MIQDLSQEVFIRLLANDCAALRRLRATTQEAMLAFLASVARTVVIDKMRRQKSAKRSAQVISLDDTSDSADVLEVPDDCSPEAELIEKLGLMRFQSFLRSALTGPNAERDLCIAQMYFVDEVSASEIARVRGFGLGVAAVEGVIHRVRKLLRAQRENFA